jgi:hypothetical protein
MQMKFKHLLLLMVLLMAGLIAISCVTTSGENGGNDETNLPNFANDPCVGCPLQEDIGSVTGIRFFSYVKTQQFDVTAGTSYAFQASVPVEASAQSSFTYSALFPGTAGYTDSRTINGYRVNGAPFNLQMNPR